tara:strand:- start:171 stop:497 length:327 start_codon:yes stop_codon:yes gene_type:complete
VCEREKDTPGPCALAEKTFKKLRKREKDTPGPCALARARHVVAPLERVEERHVGGERFFRDHVADEHHQKLVGQRCGALPHRRELVDEALARGVREVVGRLKKRRIHF